MCCTNAAVAGDDDLLVTVKFFLADCT